MSIYFYELHEGATDLMTDAILVSERDHTPAEFEDDTLVEAIARELEKSHGFTYVDDNKLQASMSVGMEPEDTYLVEQSSEFRSIVAELERS